MKTFLRNNGLSICFMLLFLGSMQDDAFFTGEDANIAMLDALGLSECSPS
jgi:hypothetical protein